MRGNIKEIAQQAYRRYQLTLFDSGVGARLPPAYRKFYDEWKNTKPEPVHYIPEPGRWKRDENGVVKHIENIPLPGIVTKELHKTLTGGEMIIQGFIKKKPKSRRVPRFWVPQIIKSVVYSEILDKYVSVLMTRRVIKLIHENEGFDNYILRTRACDLSTNLAVQFKRKLLCTLRDKELPYDEEKNKKIYDKYKEYLPPPEEIEWYGLTFGEACIKLQKMEEAEKQAKIIPLKNVYRAAYIDYLKTRPPEELSSEEKPWLSRIPGVSKLIKGTR